MILKKCFAKFLAKNFYVKYLATFSTDLKSVENYTVFHVAFK
jgi:hypothetical protein